LRLENYTNIPNDKIREMISFVRPPGISNFDIKIKNYKFGTHRGRCYPEGCPGYHDTANPLVVVSITKNEKVFPLYESAKKGSGYINSLLLSREALVHVLAHELRHLWHKKIPKGYRVWGARGQYSDRDADAYAIKKVREWRSQSSEYKTTDAMGLCIVLPKLDEKIYVS
jgi:hypothetical protein